MQVPLSLYRAGVSLSIVTVGLFVLGLYVLKCITLHLPNYSLAAELKDNSSNAPQALHIHWENPSIEPCVKSEFFQHRCFCATMPIQAPFQNLLKLSFETL